MGSGAAGLAHRVLGHGREASRARVRDPRRRARSSFPAPRERARAVERAGSAASRASGCTTGCSSSRARRWQVGGKQRHASRGARQLGARDATRLLLTGHWRKPTRLLRRDARSRPRRAPNGFREVFRSRGRDGSGTAPGSGSPRRSTTTSTRPRRSRSCTSGATTSSCVARSGSSASSRSRRATRLPRSVVELAERRIEARGARDFGEADRLRAAIEDAGWDVRDEAGGYRLVRRR